MSAMPCTMIGIKAGHGRLTAVNAGLRRLVIKMHYGPCCEAGFHMCHEILARLREDHKRYERFFRAIDEICDRAESGNTINRLRLKAIAAYLGEYALPAHHALEDAIFAQIVRVFPHFQEEMYDLIEDHETCKREFQIFERALELEDFEFVEPARSFVANERGHFIAEEEIIFAYAVKHLSSDQWLAVGDFLAPVKNFAEVGLIKDLIS
jgi:hemerythrin-like domain-containing protein